MILYTIVNRKVNAKESVISEGKTVCSVFPRSLLYMIMLYVFISRDCQTSEHTKLDQLLQHCYPNILLQRNATVHGFQAG